MADYDPDLIASLAAGLLPPADVAAQRRSLAAFRQASAPVLSTEERTELRRAVAAALHLEEARTPSPPSRRRLPWRPIAIAATAVAALAVAVPLVALLSVGGEQAAMTTNAEAGAVPRSAEDSIAEDWSLLAEAGSPTAAATLGVEPATPDPDLEKAVDALLSDPSSLISSSGAYLSACADEAGAALPGAASLHSAQLDTGTRQLVVWFVTTGQNTVTRLAVFDPADCRLLAARP
jgi:hypothetical protein